jgi:hypothetical protein
MVELLAVISAPGSLAYSSKHCCGHSSCYGVRRLSYAEDVILSSTSSAILSAALRMMLLSSLVSGVLVAYQIVAFSWKKII